MREAEPEMRKKQVIRFGSYLSTKDPVVILRNEERGIISWRIIKCDPRDSDQLNWCVVHSASLAFRAMPSISSTNLALLTQ